MFTIRTDSLSPHLLCPPLRLLQNLREAGVGAERSGRQRRVGEGGVGVVPGAPAEVQPQVQGPQHSIRGP